MTIYEPTFLVKPAKRWRGRLEYYLFPNWRNGWGGPFNGQKRRKELFEGILHNVSPKAIVETGTFRGRTASYFAETGLPVYSVEYNPRVYGFARELLRGYDNVVMLEGDSRAGLRQFLGTALSDKLQDPLFFYLDAHWNADLPLAEELDIIFAACARPVVMIDDFEVPDDAGYGYDDYGGANVLNAEYIAPSVERYGMSELYPSAPSSSETGAKRGSVILCGKTDAAILLDSGLCRRP